MGEPAQISCTFPEGKGQTDPGNSDDCPPPPPAGAAPAPCLTLLSSSFCSISVAESLARSPPTPRRGGRPRAGGGGGSPPAPQVGLEVSGSTETPVGLNISVLSSLNIPLSLALEMTCFPGGPHSCVSLFSLSLSEAVGVLRSVLRLALAGRCHATSSAH